MARPDLEPLLSVLEHDPAMKEMVATFVAEMPQRREDLRRSIEANDLSRALRIAHQQKGAAGGYGFKALGVVAAETERLLLGLLDTNSSDLAALRAAATPLLEACGRVGLSTSRAAA